MAGKSWYSRWDRRPRRAAHRICIRAWWARSVRRMNTSLLSSTRWPSPHLQHLRRLRRPFTRMVEAIETPTMLAVVPGRTRHRTRSAISMHGLHGNTTQEGRWKTILLAITAFCKTMCTTSTLSPRQPSARAWPSCKKSSRCTIQKCLRSSVSKLNNNTLNSNTL